MHIYDVGLVGFVMLLPIIPLMTGINFLSYTTQNMCGLTQKNIRCGVLVKLCSFGKIKL